MVVSKLGELLIEFPIDKTAVVCYNKDTKEMEVFTMTVSKECQDCHWW